MKIHQFRFSDLVKTWSHIFEIAPEESKLQEPRIILDDFGAITKIYLSKSLLKVMYYNGDQNPICPYYFYHVHLQRDIYIPPTLSMLKGLYFETYTIGMTAGEAIYDLPRHKINGSKLKDHERIDDAINRFKYAIEEHQMIINKEYVQVHKERIWEDKYNRINDVEVFITGTFDIISPVQYNNIFYPAAVIDLKLTKDRDICKHPYCWGCPKEMDFTEAMLYSNLSGLPFFYFVFDYRPTNPWYKLIPIKTNISHPQDIEANVRLRMLDQTIRSAVSSILHMEAKAWPKEPDQNPALCRSCPLKCEYKNIIEPL